MADLDDRREFLIKALDILTEKIEPLMKEIEKIIQRELSPEKEAKPKSHYTPGGDAQAISKVTKAHFMASDTK